MLQAADTNRQFSEYAVNLVEVHRQEKYLVVSGTVMEARLIRQSIYVAEYFSIYYTTP